MSMQETESLTIENLFAQDQLFPAVTDKLNIASGEGNLKRGCLLTQEGKACSNSAGTARVVEITPTVTTAAAGEIKVIVGEKEYSITTTSSSSVATVCDDIVAALNDSEDGDEFFTATDNSTKVTLTAKSKGVAANSISISSSVGDSGFTIAENQTTAGANAVDVYAVLAQDVNATSSSVEAPVYLTGEFNAKAVSVKIGTGESVSNFKVSARNVGIFLKEIIE